MGDPGYALKPFLMVPYADDGPDKIYKKLVYFSRKTKAKTNKQTKSTLTKKISV